MNNLLCVDKNESVQHRTSVILPLNRESRRKMILQVFKPETSVHEPDSVKFCSHLWAVSDSFSHSHF